jgi:hypothetical protein
VPSEQARDDPVAREARRKPRVQSMETKGPAGVVRYGGSVCLVLDRLFNSDAIASEMKPRDGSFDRPGARHGNTFPWRGCPRGGRPFAPEKLKGVTFTFPPYLDGSMNNVACDGQVIHLEPAAYRALYVLGASEDDSQESGLTLLVGDGREKKVAFPLTGWSQDPTYGEVLALRWGHRINSGGNRDQTPCAMFAQTIELPPGDLLRGLRLPRNPRMHVFALTLQEHPTEPGPSAPPPPDRDGASSASKDSADADPWIVGETRRITWRPVTSRRAMASGQPSPVRIDIARGDAAQWETIVDRTANDGRHEWRVTGPQAIGCRLRAVEIGRPRIRRRCRQEPTILGPEAGTAVFADISTPDSQRWADIADNPYSAAYNANFSYGDANVRIAYGGRAPTFMGQLQAEGLKPNFAYQIKLLGDRSDTWAFEAIGFQGRWLIDPDKHRRTNFKDEEYRKYRDNFDADVQSYIYFDYFVTDSDGKATKPFRLDSSFHVTWNKELNLKRRGPGRRDSEMFVHTVQPQGKAYWWDVPTGPPIIQLWLEQEGVSPRPPKGCVALPAGSYRAAVQLTEESFHLKHNRGWARVLQAPVRFEIVPDEGPVPW